MKIYLIGSLRNKQIPSIGSSLRDAGFETFDDWYAAGPEADDKWRDYEKARGRTFVQALNFGEAAHHVFQFDKRHLDKADAAVLVCPAGKSAFLELGYMIGRGKPGYILLDDPDRWDVMFLFANGVYTQLDHLIGKVLHDNVPAQHLA